MRLLLAAVGISYKVARTTDNEMGLRLHGLMFEGLKDKWGTHNACFQVKIDAEVQKGAQEREEDVGG